MLRLIHNQTVSGAILVDDIDDGLPNKTAHRLGSTGNPKAYKRDGYANAAKQPCYVQFSHTTPGGTVIAGFMNLNQTPRVLLSAGKGKISKLQTAGLITVVSLTAANLAAPVVTGDNVSSNPTINGTTLSSVAPDTTTVTFARAGGGTTPAPAVWTQAAIIGAGGTISGTSIVIPSGAFSQVPVAGNTVQVNANEQNSNVFTLT